ncbi:hypothetical protein J6590_037698 [Homalodisca vitripennis]|nr:hypothetical protein J6590_037698 [Homalodisca vitripennis]
MSFGERRLNRDDRDARTEPSPDMRCLGDVNMLSVCVSQPLQSQFGGLWRARSHCYHDNRGVIRVETDQWKPQNTAGQARLGLAYRNEKNDIV